MPPSSGNHSPSEGGRECDDEEMNKNTQQTPVAPEEEEEEEEENEEPGHSGSHSSMQLTQPAPPLDSSLTNRTLAPPPSRDLTSHDLSYQTLGTSPLDVNNPSAPFMRVTTVAFRVVREVERKVVDKRTGRVLDLSCEQVSMRRRRG